MPDASFTFTGKPGGHAFSTGSVQRAEGGRTSTVTVLA